MEKFVISVLTLYGPLALGWVLAVILAWYVARRDRDHREDYRQLAKDVQHALENNTKVLTAINIRLEDRQRE